MRWGAPFSTTHARPSFAYSSADSWKPRIHVSDWLILCCGNLMLYQKKKWKWPKHKFCDEKQKKKIKQKKKYPKKQKPKRYIKVLSNIFLWISHTDLWCNMLQTLERRRKYIGVILSDEHTLWSTRYTQRKINTC